MYTRGLKILNMVKEKERDEQYINSCTRLSSEIYSNTPSTKFRNYETATTFQTISEESINMIRKTILNCNSNNNGEMSDELTTVKLIETNLETDLLRINNDGSSLISQNNGKATPFQTTDERNVYNICEPILSDYYGNDTNSNSDNSDSEYLPSLISSSESELEGDESDRPNIVSSNHIINIEQTPNEVDIQQEPNTIINITEKTGPNTSLTVPTSQPRGQNKFWCCPFCKERVSKFARHLERRHRSEEKVSNFLQLPPRDQQRIAIISELRNKGTFIHNLDSSLHKGQIIVSRRPQAHMKRKANDYIPCPSCKGYYKKDSLHKHTKTCGVQPVLVRGVQQVSRALLVNNTIKANDLMISHIIPKLRPDEVSDEIKNDSLILLFGSFLSEKYAKDLHLDAFLRQKLRQLGRFLKAAKDINKNVKDLAFLLQPKEYDTVISAVRKACGFDIKQRIFKKPVLALNLGTILTQCAKFFIGQCIRENNFNRQKLVEDFLHIHKIEYSSRISRTATAVQKESSWNNAQELNLPQAEDVEKMVSFLKSESARAYVELKKGFNNASWNELAGTTLLRVLMFNRKRVGELERLLIKNYKSRQGISKNSDAFRTLSPVEQALSYKFERVEIRGKKGRRVPVLLAPEQILYIDLILELREQANVPSDNPYVFGKLGNDSTYRYFSACKLFRDYASKCGANLPGNLRGTKLRKQISTICQVMDLSENDTQLLADYLGHDIAIHKAHYRTPELTLQVSKVAKILIAAEDKQVEKYRGQCLNTLDIQINESNSADMTEFNEDTALINFDVPNNQNQSSHIEQLDDRDSVSSHDEEKTNNNKSSTVKSTLDAKSKLKKSGKIIRRTWVTPEKRAVRQHFAEYLEKQYLPSLRECQDAIRTDKRLGRRTPDQVKAWINNQVRRSLCMK